MEKSVKPGQPDIAPQTQADLEHWREKCVKESDKRINPQGILQYTATTNEYAHFRDDPNGDAEFCREPLTDEVEVVIIGGGFAGLQAAAHLRRLGVEDIRIIDAGSDFGGTWYWNQYPGVQCDIDAYCYLPLLEETGYIPKEKYSYGPEILEHSNRIGEFYDLYSTACFQTKVTDLTWDEKIARWTVSTDRNDAMKARFVIMGLGPLNIPKLPALSDMDTFEGHAFHAARWDYQYTGGDTTGGLEKLAGKRVALIGTGATAIQCAPKIAESADQFYLLQRTPSSVDERRNRPTDFNWAESLQPGWQKERRGIFDAITEGDSVDKDLIDDLWTQSLKQLTNVYAHIDEQSLPEEEIARRELADFYKSKTIHERIDAMVSNKATADKLKIWYRYFCKRPCFNDDYLPMFNRSNVTLIDTSSGTGLERATKTGIVVNGEELKLDCIIFSTGFEAGTSFLQRAGFEVTGQEGKTLSERWSRGPRTLHGHSTRGFPNLFNIAIVSQNANSINITAVLNTMAEQIAYIVSEVKDRKVRYTQPTAAAEASWVEEITSSPAPHQTFLASCTPGYFNLEGHAKYVPFGFTYSQGFRAFEILLADWRKQGHLDGMELVD